MARLELDSAGHLLLDGQPHQVDPAGAQLARDRSPRLFEAIQSLAQLIALVDDEEWRTSANTMFVELLDAMHTEVFGSCCPKCRIVIDATFGSSLSPGVS